MNEYLTVNLSFHAVVTNLWNYRYYENRYIEQANNNEEGSVISNNSVVVWHMFVSKQNLKSRKHHNVWEYDKHIEEKNKLINGIEYQNSYHL